MNWNVIESKWDFFKGKVREKWGKLTDDDLTAIKGRRDQLAAKLQERYGYAQDRIDDEVDDFIQSVGPSDTDRSHDAGRDYRGV